MSNIHNIWFVGGDLDRMPTSRGRGTMEAADVVERPASPRARRARGMAAGALACLILVPAAGCSDAPLSGAAPARADRGRSPASGELPAPGPGGFTDVSLAAGLDARNRLDDLTNLVDAVGTGAAFADLDGDGWLDLAVLAGPRSPSQDGRGRGDAAGRSSGFHLYRNNTDGRFAEITDGSGIPADTTAVAIAVADVDGDGDRDLYLVDRGPNRLFLNRGDATFDEAGPEAGVSDDRFGVGAVFFDMEDDGDLDLYVTNYVEFDARESAYYGPDGFPGPMAYRAEPDVLYENLGGGRFRDISLESGIGALRGRGMSLAAGDVDDDGDTDLFVANDTTENFLLINEGDRRFTEAGFPSGLALGANGERTSAMAADFGDVDRDGQIDLVVSDTAYGAFYRRVSPGIFLDEVMSSGIAMLCAQYVTWGQNLLDVDNDGDLDLLVVNGGLHHLVGWEDLILANDGTGHFSDASDSAGAYFRQRLVGRGSIVGDYDNDGDLDIFITVLAGRHVLLRNDTRNGGSWITLDLRNRSGADAFGARVTVRSGESIVVHESRCPTGYLGQSDPRVHVGLGPGIDRIDAIGITWADGTRTDLLDVPARQILSVRQEASP